ncbi:colanic acid biosynthesis glycosyltransferase WcaL [Pelagibius litoralis]|uniref:Colanic acid biosynthesis glycosyltransferase WcaL n=1 Tax=Pelagibius litoralis TaxID=374515 RepID=A0A967EYD2_9PROT|nr:glycosyltransferase [Pelagibius litoralis]NIA69677.1 colanic acid biosynthesis glycosyltransferase WcaL [Pelagibius litoralis]
MVETAPLRIGYVLKRFPRLSETFILNEILALERAGVEVEIFSLLRPPAEDRHALLSELKAPVTYLPSKASAARLTLKTGLEAERASFADVFDDLVTHPPLFSGKSPEDVAVLHLKASVLAFLAHRRGIRHFHAHFGSDAATAALLLSRLTGGSFSYTAHARDIYHTYTSPLDDARMRRAKMAEARFLVTVSDYNAEHLRSLCPNAAQRIHRLYNGIDLTRFVANETMRQPGRIISVGRFIEKKGFPILIEACRILRDRGQLFDCLILGDGPLRTQLEAQIDRLGLTDVVRLGGSLPQERLIAEMQTGAVVTLPCIVSESGDRDGLPTVLLEAMALGLPVVTTTVSGGPEIVVESETGHLCPPGNPAALAAALESLLVNPLRAAQMGAAGRGRAERLFDLERNVASLRVLFENAQGGTARIAEVGS